MEAKSFLLTSHLLSVKEKPSMISMFNGSRKQQKQQSSKFAINTVRFSVNKGKCSLETSEAQLSSGYAMGPPWFFKGSALYQLHLVKTEVARSFIPKEFKLVEAFGYTLGGFFLASYDDSPVAKFDELVVIAGIVWNPPTSCAWAARVLVNNEGACSHGRTEIGLPSNVGIFSKQRAASKIREKFTGKHNIFLSMIGINSTSRKEHIEVKISEVNDFNIMPLCSIDVPSLDPKLNDDKWMGPKIKLSLPSFSGRTIHHPPLLKYTCQIECRIRVISVAKVSRNTSKNDDDDSNNDRLALAEDAKGLHKCISIMLSKPVLALEFNFLKMQVNAPRMVLDDLGTLSRD